MKDVLILSRSEVVTIEEALRRARPGIVELERIAGLNGEEKFTSVRWHIDEALKILQDG